jgi:dolichol-phosphate mannosyltransferase
LPALELSVVSPFYNESENLPSFINSLKQSLGKFDSNYELILVDDGSTDDSFNIAAKLDVPNLTVIKLTKNFGHQNALDAGIRHASGQWIVTLDSDLQHPTDAILKMLEIAKEQNVDVIYGAQKDRKKDKLFKRFTAAIYYKLLRKLTGVSIVSHASDFRVISNKVADVLKNLPEEKVFRLLLPYLGFSSTVYEYSAEKRKAGKSKYTFIKMFKLAINSIVSFSTTPLRIVTAIGFLASLVAFLWTIVVINSYLKGDVIAGWTSMTLIILLLGGMQLFAIGVVGEYLARNLELSKNRPNYLIQEIRKNN